MASASALPKNNAAMEAITVYVLWILLKSHSECYFRFLDSNKSTVVTLKEAIEPLVPILPEVQKHAWLALPNCEDPADGLTPNESAAVVLYTMEWEPREQNVSMSSSTPLYGVRKELNRC